jgi:hypothetical protein
MDPPTAGLMDWGHPYQFSEKLDAIAELPVAACSTRSLTGRWSAHAGITVQSELSEQDQMPVGRVTNALPFPLDDCRLCYGRWVYPLGDLGPGQSAEISPASDRRDLNTFLTGRKLLGEGRQVATPYDQASTDVLYILRAMMFFQAAGGRRYTGLFNQYQAFVDLSGLLAADRAILVATSSAADPHRSDHGVQLLCDGRPLENAHGRHTTLCRFVLPIGKGTGAR